MFEAVALVIRYSIAIWMIVMAVATVHRIFADRIMSMSLIINRRTGMISIHRVQMIGISLLFAIGYLIDALGSNPANGMPNISTPLLAALLGSHAAYLGGTAYRLRGERR